jgi:hypothetical protein
MAGPSHWYNCLGYYLLIIIGWCMVKLITMYYYDQNQYLDFFFHECLVTKDAKYKVKRNSKIKAALDLLKCQMLSTLR